ncbi:MAG: PAS domain S-box protein [Natronomonas sp.]
MSDSTSISGASTDPVRVLCVDDEPEVAELTQIYLQREDDRFEVTTATSAADGLQRLEDGEFDCVVSDYDMPKTNGIEFLEAVRRTHPELPFVLFTGKGSEEVASEAISAGVTDYLQKTSNPDQYTLLANRILNAVEQFRATQRAAELDRINRVIRDVNDALVRATTREEIDRRVCEILNDAEPYLFVWIGDPDPDTRRVESRESAGIEEGYLDEITITADETETGQGPVGRALREGRVATTQNIRDDDRFDPWREAAIERGYESIAAIPLRYGDTAYGCLTVYADSPDAFDDRERRLLADLGDTIAHAYRRIEIQTQYTDQYRTLFEEAPVMFVLTEVVDGDPIIEDCNREFAETLGYERDELRGRPLADLYVEASRTDLLDANGYDRALSGEFVREQRTLLTRDGEAVLTILRASPRRNRDGEIIGTHGLFLDITDEQQIQKLKRYETIFEQLNDAVYVLDETETIVYVNESYASLKGVDRETLIGTEISQWTDPDTLETVERARDAIRSGDDDFESVETIFETADGEQIPVEIRLLHNERGESVERIGVIRDISERRERKRELRRYETTIKALGDPVYTVDSDGRYTFINEAYAALTGYDREEIVGAHVSFLLDDASVERANDTVRTLLSEDDVDQQTYEITVRRVDGEEIYCEDNISLLPTDDGTYAGAAGVVRDITERKKREEQLEINNTRLEELAGIVSHDLRNPLSVATGRLELAQEVCDSEHLDAIEQAHARMRTLIEDMLALARAETELSDPELIDFERVVDRSWASVETGAATLETAVDGRVRANDGRLQQLLENLIRNSVEHCTTAGRPEANVTVTVGKLDDGFYLEDDGPGIPPTDRDTVFEAGYSTTDGGTGLGLNIVRRIATAHDWTVTVTDGTDGGVRFEFRGVERIE